MLVKQHGIVMTIAHNGRNDAPLPWAWACFCRSTSVAGIVNKVKGGAVHHPGVMPVDGKC